MAQRLTDKLVKALPAPARGNKVTYDDKVKGFGARVTTAGAISFVINYRVRSGGQERRYTIGSYPDWSVDAARTKAKELKRRIDDGGDPVGDHVADRAAPTVSDLCDRFLEEHVDKLRPASRADYASIIRNDIRPALGKMKVAAVAFDHIERLHAQVTKRAPVRANRLLSVASAMFNLAVRWRYRTDNPCKGVRRNREHGRRRYLTPEELRRLTKALAAEPNQTAADVIRLLLLTGSRRSEVLAAKWTSINLDSGIWVKPHTATKQGREHRVPLSAPARQLLARRLKCSGGSPTVFGVNGGRDALKRAWRRILAAADITELRLHDLRHSFASQLVSGGASLPLIGSLLGHSSPTTTARYSHLYDDPQRAAVERVGAVFSGKPLAEVVPLKRGRRR